MIKGKTNKIKQIIATIETRIAEINSCYRNGPDLYFYRKIIHLKASTKDIKAFINKYENIECLYTTLLSWDMNCRRAKMKYFDDFKLNIESCLDLFLKIENFEKTKKNDFNKIIPVLKETYNKLDVMETFSKLVSNAKILHFLFPSLLMPIDGTNTLCFFYENSGVSLSRYLEIISIQFEIINGTKNLECYLDKKWNTTIPKMIDNAIILIEGKSIRNKT